MAGRNVWKTDGTPEGTVQVTFIDPYRQGHARLFVGVINGKLLYNGDIRDNGGLYMIDTAGTALPVRISQIISHGSPSLVHGGFLYYYGSDGFVRTDGTAAGTTFFSLKATSLSDLVSIGDFLYFVGATQSGVGLHRWDGASTVSTLVKPMEENQLYTELQRVGDRMYFGTRAAGASPGGLWVSDGTAEGTSLLREDALPIQTSASFPTSGPTTVGGRLLFFARTGGVWQLWTTDGTAAGTAFLSNRLWGDNQFMYAAAAAGSLYFSFVTGEQTWTYDLYVTDGLPGGLRKLTTINGTSPPYFFVWNGKFFFHNGDPVHGSEWWISDGTESGTHPFGELLAGRRAGVSSIRPLVRPDGVLFGASEPDSGTEPWFFDGETGQARMLRNIGHDGIHGSDPALLAAAGDTLFFSVLQRDGSRVGHSDGTSAGTSLPVLVDDNTRPSQAVVSGGRYFFVIPEQWTTRLMVSDGTSEGTGTITHGPKSIVAFRGGVGSIDKSGSVGFFDGSGSGTRPVEDLYDQYARMLASHDAVWFSTRGQLRVGDLADPARVVVPEGRFVHLAGLAEIGGIVYLLSDDSESVSLWRSDGTQAGTWRVATVPQSPRRISAITASSGHVFFMVDNLLSRSDGTTLGTTTISLPVAESTHMYCAPFLLPFQQGIAAYVYDDNQPTLWSTDGTPAGTTLLARMPSPSQCPVSPAAVQDGLIYFGGWDAAHGVEPWVSDGTMAGTRLLAELQPGIGPSLPMDFTVAAKRVFFSAYTLARGRELWAFGNPFNGRARAVRH